MSARVTPRSLRTSLVPRITSLLAAVARQPAGIMILLDQGNAPDQRARRAAGRVATGHEAKKPTDHRLLTAAVPRARALVDEHLRQIIELYRIAARASTVGRRVVLPDN